MVMTKLDIGMIAIKKEGTFISSFRGHTKEVPYKWVVMGETYSYKDVLKANGGEFNWDTKSWHFNTDKLPAAIEQVVGIQTNFDDLTAPDDLEPPIVPEPEVIEKIVAVETVKWRNLTYKRKALKPKAKVRKSR